LALGGCKTGPPPPPKIIPFDLTVERSPELATETIEVDIIGADESLKKALESVAIKDYFEPEGLVRKDALREGKTLLFPAGEAGAKPQVLPQNDPVWGEWSSRKARYLVIITNLRVESGASYDPRREIAPISLKAYDPAVRKEKRVEIKLLPSRIVISPHV